VIDDNFDPYRQAIENLQREELDPLDIADWVEKREAAGDSRNAGHRRLAGAPSAGRLVRSHLGGAQTSYRGIQTP
jgi:hypothetical protein